MIPDAVLTEDQKVIRFRKTILKRRKESGGSTSNTNDNDIASPGEEEGEEEDNEEENVFRTISSISPTLIPSDDFDQKFDLTGNGNSSENESDFKTKIPRIEDLIESLSEEDCKIKLEDNFLEDENFDCDDLQNFLTESEDEKITHKDLPQDFELSPKLANKFEYKIDRIARAYQMAIMQMKSGSSEQLIKKLTAAQSGDRSVNFGKKEILQYIVQLSEQFRHFALLQR